MENIDKIGVLGDLHLTSHNPERRKDNYLDTAFIKLVQALEAFKRNECFHIFQVGDFFDSPQVSRSVDARVIRLLNEYPEMKFYCCYGQHDIFGHSKSTLPNSPLSVLESAGLLKIANENPITLGNCNFWSCNSDVDVYGASFGEGIPTPSYSHHFNILITHRQIGNRQLWPGQELENPRCFLREHPDYNIVLCGDYHYSFVDKLQKQIILNPGALMRQSITDIESGLKPAAYIVYTDTNTLDYLRIDLPFQKAEDIFDLTKKEQSKNSEALNKLIEDLRNSSLKNKRDWKRILLKVQEEKQASQKSVSFINEAMEELKI